jgi:signal transduction histidine kinase
VHQAFFAYVLLGRHLGAIEGVEQANVVLSERLREREAELRASHEQMREVQEREAVQRERQRLMQDLHDGMGSQLISALRVAEEGQLGKEQMRDVLRECIDDLKLTVESLEPVGADLLLLLATLRYRWATRLQQAGIRIEWQAADTPPLPWLDPRGALHILRILQEAFSNAVQHAGATHLRIATEVDEQGITVLVEDNGQGLPDNLISMTAGQTMRPGRGLANMAQRARAIGGQVDWRRMANGTQLRLWLPLQREVG